MKLLSYRAEGRDRYGVLSGDGVIDLAGRLGDRYPGLRDLLGAGGLDPVRELLVTAAPDHALADISFDLPIPNAPKVLCAGRNYRAYHEVAEDGRTPDHPTVFARFLSSFAAHGENILKPKAGDKLDYEGELVAVIGKRGRHVDREQALGHVAGYTIMNDGSVRDWSKIGAQNTPAKNFYRAGGLGPWVVTADAIADPMALHITTRRNGQVVQDGSTAQMIFDIPHLIAHISRFTWLEPGDLIATGSPGGTIAEQEMPKWLTPGDEIAVEIEAIGVLSNSVAAE